MIKDNTKYMYDKPFKTKCLVLYNIMCNELRTIITSPPHEMGRHILISALLSVRPSVCLSVRNTFMSALYLLNPWWDLQITLHKCQV